MNSISPGWSATLTLGLFQGCPLSGSGGHYKVAPHWPSSPSISRGEVHEQPEWSDAHHQTNKPESRNSFPLQPRMKNERSCLLQCGVQGQDKLLPALYLRDVHRRSRLRRHANRGLGDDSRVHEADSEVRTFTSLSLGRCCGRNAGPQEKANLVAVLKAAWNKYRPNQL